MSITLNRRGISSRVEVTLSPSFDNRSDPQQEHCVGAGRTTHPHSEKVGAPGACAQTNAPSSSWPPSRRRVRPRLRPPQAPQVAAIAGRATASTAPNVRHKASAAASYAWAARLRPRTGCALHICRSSGRHMSSSTTACQRTSVSARPELSLL